MLTNKDIARKIFETLRDSEALRTKCEELFNKAHSVYLGFSGSQAPPPERRPALEIISWNQERGETQDKVTFVFSVLLSLDDEVLEDEVTCPGVFTQVHQGPEAAEDILLLVLQAIRGMSADLDYDEMSLEFDAVEYFPIFTAVLTLTIAFPVLAGGYEPTL
jgi:hypothetical protein